MNKIKKIIRNLESIPKLDKNKSLFFNEYYKLGFIGVIDSTLHKGNYVFRSRINETNSSFSSHGEISYPPHQPTDFGRAHCPSSKMFYGSYKPQEIGEDEIGLAYIVNAYEISAFLRDNESIGKQKITIGKWRIVNDIRLAMIVFHDKFREKTILSQNLNSNFNRMLQNSPNLSDDTNMWNKFISQEFAKEVDDSKSNEYIISATYTEFLLNKNFDGVIYPTVKLDGRGFNIALSPQAVDSSLKIEIVGEGRFYKDKKHTILDWEKICVVEDPNNFVFKEDSNHLGEEYCLKVIDEQKQQIQKET